MQIGDEQIMRDKDNPRELGPGPAAFQTLYGDDIPVSSSTVSFAQVRQLNSWKLESPV